MNSYWCLTFINRFFQYGGLTCYPVTCSQPYLQNCSNTWNNAVELCKECSFLILLLSNGKISLLFLPYCSSLEIYLSIDSLQIRSLPSFPQWDLVKGFYKIQVYHIHHPASYNFSYTSSRNSNKFVRCYLPLVNLFYDYCLSEAGELPPVISPRSFLPAISPRWSPPGSCYVSWGSCRISIRVSVVIRPWSQPTGH